MNPKSWSSRFVLTDRLFHRLLPSWSIGTKSVSLSPPGHRLVVNSPTNRINFTYINFLSPFQNHSAYCIRFFNRNTSKIYQISWTDSSKITIILRMYLFITQSCYTLHNLPKVTNIVNLLVAQHTDSVFLIEMSKLDSWCISDFRPFPIFMSARCDREEYSVLEAF